MSKRTLPRREFLKTLSAGAILPGTAAGFSPSPDRIATMRQEWADLERSYLDTLFFEQVRPAGPEFSEAAIALGRGLGAMKVFKDIEALDIETQIKPDFQALILDVADAVGGAIQASGVMVTGYFSGHGATDEGGANLVSALQATRYTVRDWRCTVGHQKRLESALLELERQPPRQLRRQARKDARDVARMERLATQLAEAGPTTGLLTGSDPAVLRRITASGVTPSIPVAGFNNPRVILGLLALGLAFYGGMMIAALGVCNLACGGGVGVFLMGLGIMGLSVWAAVKIIRNDRNAPVAAQKPDPYERDFPDEPPEPVAVAEPVVEPITEPVVETPTESTPALVGTRATIAAGSGWTAATIVLKKKQSLSVQATGQLGSTAGWLATPDGNGAAAAEGTPLPGAPAGSLIGRIGGTVFFIGSQSTLKAPESGRLWLGINLTGSDPVEGAFTVTYAID